MGLLDERWILADTYYFFIKTRIYNNIQYQYTNMNHEHFRGCSDTQKYPSAVIGLF